MDSAVERKNLQELKFITKPRKSTPDISPVLPATVRGTNSRKLGTRYKSVYEIDNRPYCNNKVNEDVVTTRLSSTVANHDELCLTPTKRRKKKQCMLVM